MKSLAKNLRRLATDAEHRLWQQLRNRQVCNAKFRRQHPVPPYIVDFVCLEKRLVIEVDGGQHVKQKVSDEKRSAFLESRGFRVLRFWNDEILLQTDDVLDVIFHASNETPHPNPLPKGERAGVRE